MKIKHLFWRKNIFGELRRAFLGINCEDSTWKGLKKDHALEWGDPNENPGYWSIIFDKIYTQEENKNKINLSNSLNDFKIWATSNPKRGDRPKVSRRIWGPSQEDIIESWYLKNFILTKKIISDYLIRKKIKSGSAVKLYNIITERLEELNKINNLNYFDISTWAEINKNIFNDLILDTTWFIEKNLKQEIEKYFKDKSYIILFNTHEDEKSFYTTIINEGEFLEFNFFNHVSGIKNNGGYFKDAKFKNNKIDNNFLYAKNLESSNNQSDTNERVKSYLKLLDKRIDDKFSKIAIEDRYQQDINSVEATKIEEGPIEKKNRKGSDLSNQYKYQRNPSISANALEKANYLCEIDTTHKTFSQENLRNYVEGHHVIPMAAQENFEYSIDVPENIVALCPNCHRKVHLAKTETRLKIVEKLFNIINKRKLSDRKIKITLDELKEYYK